MDTSLQTILAELRDGLETHYGGRLAQLILFGSHARGDAGPKSDIDIMVVLEEPVIVCDEIAGTNEIMTTLSLKYKTAICLHFISEERYRAEQTPLLSNVHKEGLPI